MYTINWFSVDAIYDGVSETANQIPVITPGGGNDYEFVLVHHADYFHKNYKYITAVKPCADCVENMLVYVPITYVADFQGDIFSEQRNTLQNISRIGDVSKKEECKKEAYSILYVSLGNVNLEFDGALVHGKVDIKTRTNGISRSLVDLSCQIKYDTDFFGEDVVLNQVVQPSFSETVIEQYYDMYAQDVLDDQFMASMEKDFLQGGNGFVIINTFMQPTMTLEFTLPISTLENLQNYDLNELIVFDEVSASFFCEEKEYRFDEVVFEQNTIGVSYKGSRGNGGITYSFETSYNSDDSRYTIKFFASSPEPTVLYEGTLFLNYSIDAFFENQHSEGLLEGLDGMIWSEFESVTASDFNESTLRIDFTGGDLPFGSLAIIEENPTSLFSLSLLMEDCLESPGLSFNEAEMQELSMCLDEEGILSVYDPVIATHTDNLILCNDCATLSTPEITSLDFPLDGIVAGDNQVLIITGNNFGEGFQRTGAPSMNGTGSSVLFYNGDYTVGGDQPKPKFIAAGRKDFVIDDILKWTNNEIQVKVPSTDYQFFVAGTASSGPIIVRNGCNYESEEEDSPDVYIPYSLINYRTADEGSTYNTGLRNSDPFQGSPNDGYEFQFDPSISSNLKSIFDSALDEWCSTTNVRFKQKSEINTEPFGGIVVGDGVSSVQIGSSGGGHLTFTTAHFNLSCGILDGDPDGGYLLQEIDMTLSPAITIISDEKAKATLMHELGHAHLLGHARCNPENCTKPLMNPDAATGADVITSVDATGGNRIFTTSANIVNSAENCFHPDVGAISSVTPIEQGSCGIQTNINKVDLLNITIHPNPTTSELYLKGADEFDTFIVRDLQGRELLSGEIYIGLSRIDLQAFAAGTYILSIQGNEGTGHIKLIKI